MACFTRSGTGVGPGVNSDSLQKSMSTSILQYKIKIKRPSATKNPCGGGTSYTVVPPSFAAKCNLWENNGMCRVRPTSLSAGQFRSAGHCISKSIGSQQPPTLCSFLQIRLLHHYFSNIILLCAKYSNS
ncbi:hypothetical protein B4100_2221 [Heyndrickxia coagulans]|nr:hypothetical protein B4100_2221 [Heyndrickxia coagulans]